MKPNPTDLVYVVVHERPNKVWAACNGEIHTASWRTADNGDSLRDVKGNRGLINAAVLAWGRTDNLERPVPNGSGEFVLTFKELEDRSDGWGAWRD